MKIEKNLKTQIFTHVGELEIGDMMVIQSDDPYISQFNGMILLKTFSGYVTLDNPRNTWGLSVEVNKQLKGRKLLPGESVSLIQE